MKKAKLEEGENSYMYDMFLERHTLFISANAVDSTCMSVPIQESENYIHIEDPRKEKRSKGGIFLN